MSLPPPLPLSIPVDTAAKWIGRWELSDHHLKALSFTFDADEFRAILGEESVASIRLFIGLDTQTDGAINEKMLAVGVDKDGNPLINPRKKEEGEEGTEPGDQGDDGTGIYDFSHPCPPICGNAFFD